MSTSYLLGALSFLPSELRLIRSQFANTIRGIRRRRRKATQQSIKVVAPPTEAVIAPTLTPDASPIRARVVSITQLQVDETKSLKDDLPSRRFGSPLTNR